MVTTRPWQFMCLWAVLMTLATWCDGAPNRSSEAHPARRWGNGMVIVSDSSMQVEPFTVAVSVEPFVDSTNATVTVTLRPRNHVPLRSRMILQLVGDDGKMLAQVPVAIRESGMENVYGFAISKGSMKRSWVIFDRVVVGADSTTPARYYELHLQKYLAGRTPN